MIKVNLSVSIRF